MWGSCSGLSAVAHESQRLTRLNSIVRIQACDFVARLTEVQTRHRHLTQRWRDCVRLLADLSIRLNVRGKEQARAAHLLAVRNTLAEIACVDDSERG